KRATAITVYPLLFLSCSGETVSFQGNRCVTSISDLFSCPDEEGILVEAPYELSHGPVGSYRHRCRQLYSRLHDWCLRAGTPPRGTRPLRFLRVCTVVGTVLLRGGAGPQAQPGTRPAMRRSSICVRGARTLAPIRA